MPRPIPVLAGTLLFCLVTFASFAQLPKYSNEFLAIGIGARAHGMAGAQVASVNDITAGYWNPAGMSDVQSTFQLGAMHSEWFAGIGKFDYLSLAKPIANSARNAVLGVTVIRFGVDNIPNTFNLIDADGSINFENVTPFSAADYAGFFTYSQKLPSKKMQLGASSKVIYRKVGPFGSAWGFGLDLGLIYNLKRNWRFGLMARDITSTFNAWKFNFTDEEKLILNYTDNEIPKSSFEITSPVIIAGVAYQVSLREQIRFLMEVNLDFSSVGRRNVLVSTKYLNVDPHIGMELAYKEFLFLRGGIGNIQKIKDDLNPNRSSFTFQPNVGVGLKMGGLKIDYALTNVGNYSDVLYSHVVSLIMDLKINSREKVKKSTKRGMPRPPRIIIEQID